MPDAAHRTPSPEQRREAILGQLQYLIAEAEMLRHVIGRVPVVLQEGRALEGNLSLKETLALLAALDARVRLPHLSSLQSGEALPEPPPEAALVEGANAQTAEALISVLVENRGRLVAAAEALPPDVWARAEAFLFGITQQDAEKLRALTLQLFDAQGLGR